MWKLIKLEWKKNKVGKYVRNALILAAALSLFLFAFTYLGIANDPDTGKPDAVQEEHTLSSTVEMFTSISFLVFTGVMLASFLVAAYQNKTMALMFLYPIKRQKILLSQMLAVWLFNLAALFTTKLLLYGVLLVGAQFLEPAFPIDFDMADIGFYLQAAIKAAVTVSMGFLSVDFSDTSQYRRLFYGWEYGDAAAVGDCLAGLCGAVDLWGRAEGFKVRA